MEEKNYSRMKWLLLAVTALNLALAVMLVTVFLGYRELKQQSAPSGSVSENSSDAQTEPAEDLPVQNRANQQDMSLYQAQCKEIDYEELARDADAMKRQYFTFTGKILQAMEGQYRLGTWYDGRFSSSRQIYIDYTPPAGGERILEDDVVTVWGVSEGLYTYTTTGGNEITVPRLDVGVVKRLTDAEVQQIGKPVYHGADIGKTETENGLQVQLVRALMRDAVTDDMTDGVDPSDWCIVYFMLDVKNTGTEEQRISPYRADCYTDGYKTDLDTDYDDPEGWDGLQISELEPGYGVRGHLCATVKKDWQKMELRLSENMTFTLERSIFAAES